MRTYIYFNNVQTNNKFNIKEMIENIVASDYLYIYENNRKIKNFGQVIVTTNDYSVPIIEKEKDYYTVFKISDKSIENDTVIKDFMQRYNANFDLLVQNDLVNFAIILKQWVVDYNLFNSSYANDDKNIILKNIDDKIRYFAKAITGKNLEYFSLIKNVDNKLYKEIELDFKNNIIKQPNLKKCFITLYPEEKESINSQVLMKKLREFDKDFFAKEKILTNSKGKKFFKITSAWEVA